MKFPTFICISGFILSLLICAACSKTGSDPPPGPSPTPSAFHGVRIYIVSTGDIHEYSQNLAGLATLVKNLRDTASNVYFVLAGDFFMNHRSYNLKRCDGSNETGVRPDFKVPSDSNHAYDGLAEARIVEYLDFDAIVPGNHDWTYGIDLLKRRGIRSKLVACNLAEPSGLTRDYLAFTSVKGKYSLNIIGITDTNNIHSVSGETVRVYPLTTSTSLAKINSALSSARINILLTHLLKAEDLSAFSSFKNARGQAYFDVLCGGHTHESFANITAGAAFMKAGLYGTNAGVACLWWDTVKMEVTNKSVRLVCLENIVRDPGAKALIDSLHRVYPHY